MKNLIFRAIVPSVLLTLFFTLAFVACGEQETAPGPHGDEQQAGKKGPPPPKKGGPPPGKKGPPPAPGNAPDMDIARHGLISRGELTVCTDAPYPPFEFEDDDGRWIGFDMDMMREISQRMGIELAVKVVPFDGIWLLPAAGECDVVASAMTITEERAKSTLFTDPYFDADQSLLVRSVDAEKFDSLESLSGSSIAVQTGTTGEMYAQENAPADTTLVSFDEPAAMFLALQSGEVDAILQDLPVNGDRQSHDPNFAMTDTFPTGEQYGFAVSPESKKLAVVINDLMEEMRMDGVYDLIFADYFGPMPPGGGGGDRDPIAQARGSVISEGEITVCTDAPYEPFEWEEDGVWIGFDMDLMREIAGRMDLGMSVKVVPFDGIWLLPATGECDIVASAMTITEERAKNTLFTRPYFGADQSLLVRSPDKEIFDSLEALEGGFIAVQTGTTGEMYAQENAPAGATLVSFDEPAAMFLALQSGEVDAILQDLPVNGDRQRKDPSFAMTAAFPTGEEYGFAVSPENRSLHRGVNMLLDEIQRDGTYKRIYRDYFGAPEIKPIDIGMILVGPRNDKGWSQAHFEGGQYAAERIGGKLITVDFVNPADNPDLTIPDIVSDMVDQGAELIFATSDDMSDGILEAAAKFPDVALIWSSGDSAWEEGERYKPELQNLGNIMGKMEYGQLMAGCAAAIKSKEGKIGFLGPLINAETRRLANATYIGALACAGDKTIDFKVTWIGFWFHIPGFTLDPTQVANDFYDEGRDVVISHIDTTEALVVAGQRAAAGETVWAVPYDYEGACDQAPEVCLGVNYFNWGPSYFMAAMMASSGEFGPVFKWLGPDWNGINNEDSSMIGWKPGNGLKVAEAEKVNEYIDTLAETKVIFEGPLNYQDGSVFLKAGEVATDLQIWYAPQLLEGMTGDSSSE